MDDILGEIYVPSKYSQNIFILVSWDVCGVIKKGKGKEIPQGVIQIELKTWTLAKCHVTQSILIK